MSTAFENQSLDAVLKASLKQFGVTRQSDIDQLIGDAVLRLRSTRSVGAAVSTLPPIPAGFTRAIQATENAWRRIEREHGLLTSTEVAGVVGPKSRHRSLASDMRRRGQILGVQRLNSYRYPRFQFTASGEVKPAIPALIEAASEAGWSTSSLVLWLCNPSGAFSGDLPVNHLGDDDMADIARSVMLTDW